MTDKSEKEKLSQGKVRFSFEDELTFSPRLNSLSLKMVSGVKRPSIIQRKPDKKVEDHVNFAFKPNLSVHSSKIVAKMNTCFWDRQNKVVQRRLEMIEQGPSTVHPNFKCSPSHKNKSKDGNILSERTVAMSQIFRNVKRRSSKSPYSKSVDVLLKLKDEDIEFCLKNYNKKCKDRRSMKVNCNETKLQDIEANVTKSDLNVDCTHTCNDKKLDTKNTYVNKVKLNDDEININKNKTHIASNANAADYSKGKDVTKAECSRTPTKENLVGNRMHMLNNKRQIEKLENKKSDESNFDKNNSVQCTLIERNDKKNVRKTISPLHKDRTNEMDAVHQNLLKMKKVAGQAMKNKKVFVCNGPYASLRVALRKRGWIEKHFKGGDPSLIPQLLSSNSYEEGMENNKKKEGETIENKDKENLDIAHDFMCDNQYGIMSRIVRKSMPIFLWTLKRDDIDFQYLHKDQIVNHFLFARTFTTKAGLCMTLNNLRYFDDQNASSFFPRCYRLCCDEDKEEFLEDYQITALQSILQVIVEKHKIWSKDATDNIDMAACDDEDSSQDSGSEKSEASLEDKPKKIFTSDVLRLIFKTCYEYLESKHHADIEESYCTVDNIQKKANWMKILECFKCVALENGMISDVGEYVNECRRILSKLEEYNPQQKIDGYQNIWILKPGAKSRGRGIEVLNNLNNILNISSDTVSKKENRWVIQKYIERPMLIHRTKFDIRQWFLVTDWNPLMLWFYKDCYIRFCSQEFQLDKFDAAVHLSNNSIQKNFMNGTRSEELPESNMWDVEEFQKYLRDKGLEKYWDELIYPGMKKAIIAVLISSQDSLEYRKNSFELYGADFMLGEDLQPWLIEINASPALGPSTPVTERLCRNVLEDTLKVVLDRRDNKDCDTGRFELAYKRPFVALPSYIGCTIAVDGLGLRPAPSLSKRRNCTGKNSARGVKSTNEKDSSLESNSKTSEADESNTGDENENLVDTPKGDTCDGNHEKGKDVGINEISCSKSLSRVEKIASLNDNLCSPIDSLAQSSLREEVTSSLKDGGNTIKKTRKTLINGKWREVPKNRCCRDAEIRALVEPSICAFPVGRRSQDDDSRNLSHIHPAYRFSTSPDELNELVNKHFEETDLSVPYNMRYRNIKHTTSFSRQFSLMTSQDIVKLKRRRWNSIPTEL